MSYTVWIRSKKLHRSENFNEAYTMAKALQEKFLIPLYICFANKKREYFVLTSEEMGKDRKNFEHHLWQLVAIVL